jgi:dolichol-phosphate mannosyltransferase
MTAAEQPSPVRSRALVIVPTYNERAGIAEVLRRLLETTTEDVEVLVVDDSSPDGTAAVAGSLGAEVLRRPRKDGLGGAYVAGFARALGAGAGAVVQMDADGSHDPAALPGLLALARAGADLVVGSRSVPGGAVVGWHPVRRAVSRAGCAYARAVLRLPVRDLTSGFRCWRGAALGDVDPASVRSEGYAFQVELADRALRRGLRVVETPIVFRERRAGRSKMTPRIALEAAWLVPALRSSSRPPLPK